MKTFVLTKNHIKLLREMYIEYDDSCETGGPAADPKRPYGNSCVASDVYEIINGKPAEDELPEEVERECMSLHYQTATALQIILSTGKFSPGTYKLEGYGKDWKKVK